MVVVGDLYNCVFSCVVFGFLLEFSAFGRGGSVVGRDRVDYILVFWALFGIYYLLLILF